MIQFSIKSLSGNTFSEKWEKTNCWCPNCGKKSVWKDTEKGDYYISSAHFCTECTADFWLTGGPSGGVATREEQYRYSQRLQAFKAAFGRGDVAQ